MPDGASEKMTLEIITLVISIIGALAWLPSILEWCRKPIVKGRLVGLTYSEEGSYEADDPRTQSKIRIKGICYYPKLALTALHKNFNVKLINVFVKYPNDPQIYKGTIYYAPEINLSFKLRSGKQERKTLCIPPSEHITLLTVLEQGKMAAVFIPFIIDKGTFSFFDWIEFRFFDYKDKYQSIIIRKDDIDIPNTIFEKQYWKEIPTEK